MKSCLTLFGLLYWIVPRGDPWPSPAALYQSTNGRTNLIHSQKKAAAGGYVYGRWAKWGSIASRAMGWERLSVSLPMFHQLQPIQIQAPGHTNTALMPDKRVPHQAGLPPYPYRIIPTISKPSYSIHIFMVGCNNHYTCPTHLAGAKSLLRWRAQPLCGWRLESLLCVGCIERISRRVKSQVALDSNGLPMQGTQCEGSA